MSEDKKPKFISSLELTYPRVYEYEDPAVTKKRKELGIKPHKPRKRGPKTKE